MYKLLIGIFFGILFTACSNNSATKQENDASDASSTASTADSPVAANTDNSSDTFDISTIPVSNAVLDSFPFFKLPPHMEYQNRPVEKNYDMLFFPIKGHFVLLKGKVFKTFVVGKEDKYWSLPLFKEYYEDSIKKAGGVEVFNGKVTQEEIDLIKEKATYFGEEGSIDYWNEPVEVYVIRRSDKHNIYIQFSGNTASGAIQILEEQTAAEASK